MENTLLPGDYMAVEKLSYIVKPMKRGDVVICYYPNNDDYTCVKRVIGLPGDRVGFRDGKLIRNGEAVDEPYILGPCDWDLPERTVERNHYYLAGDNRSMPMEQHRFGQVDAYRIVGAPLW